MADNCEHYSLVFEKNPQPMCVYDWETLAFLSVNKAAIGQYGYSREEFLGLTLRDIHPAEDIPLLLRHLARAKEDPGQKMGLWRHRKKDGTVFAVEINAFNVEFQGRPARLVVATDVTERKRMEASLVESEARLRTYLESASEGIVVVDRAGRIEYVNARTEEMFGYPRRQLLGESIETLLPERYHARHAERRAEYITAPRVRPMGIGMELVGLRSDGSEFPVEVGLSAVPDGSIQIAFVNDISARKRSETALRESEQRFRNLVEMTSDGVWETDECGNFTYVSPQVRGVLGREPAEMLGKTTFDFMAPEEAERVRPMYQQKVRAGAPLNRIEQIMLRADGAEVVVENNGVPFFDAQGALRGYRGIARDITERRKGDQALRESEASLSRAQRMAHLGNWEENMVTGELRWSDEVFRIFNVSETSPLKREDFFAMVHPEDQAAVRAAVAEAMRTGRPYNIDHRIVLADGAERHVREYAELVFDESGCCVRMVGTVQDITEYKRLEEQLRQSQRMEAVGRLAGGVAHDFNNLLTIISGYSELLLGQTGEDTPERKDLLEISKAAKRAAALTRQLLAFSRRQILQLRVINLNTVIADLDQMLRRLIGEDVELRLSLDPNLGMARADPTQIEQVIMNLAVNARDAMPQGGRLLIETCRAELDEFYAASHPDVQPGSYTVIAVSDTGTGIPSEILPHIFEPFFTTKARDKGTGLGLSTVYGIVKQSGGTIYVYSEPGHGTTFKIYFPLVEDVTGLVRQLPAPAAVARGSEAILVVEDEQAVRTLIRNILEAHGYSVVEAHRGKEALEILQQRAEPVDLMITDVVMPEMSGRELAEFATVLAPRMKVLYISGYTDDAIVNHGVLGSGVPFLQKPFTQEALTRKIRDLLDERRDTAAQKA